MVISECMPERSTRDPEQGSRSAAERSRRDIFVRPRRSRKSRANRKPGQAIVEFGLVVVLFALLISGMFDFGLMLNLRLSVSSLSRELDRSASLGATTVQLTTQAQQAPLLGVTTDTFSGYCCGPTDAVVVTVKYYIPTCNSNCIDEGQAAANVGDRVEVSVTAAGAEVLTALVRPAFGCTDGTAKHCFRPLFAQTSMRYEGPFAGP